MTLLGEAVEHAPVGIYVFDDQGRYVAVNVYACELLGYARKELLELRIGELAVSKHDAMREYQRVMRGEEAGHAARTAASLTCAFARARPRSPGCGSTSGSPGATAEA